MIEVKKYIEANGMTQRRLAEYLNCQPSQLCRWIKGKHKPSKLRQELIKKFLED